MPDSRSISCHTCANLAMILHAYGESNLGLIRDQNEDSFLLDDEHALFAVADGIGGMPGGEVASQSAVAAIKAALEDDPEEALGDLEALVQKANGAVQDEGRRFGGYGIGTTLTLARIAGGKAHVAHVGDSFALLVRGGSCRPLTREHNVENERGTLLDLSPYPASHRYALTRSLGQPDKLNVDLSEHDLAAGDTLILATDGLTDLVAPEHIAILAERNDDPRELVEVLIAAALEAGGHDNVTVIGIRIAEV